MDATRQPQALNTGTSLHDNADQPNMPEVSGTSFPLLTTVLSGFAVTIAVQLIIRPDDTADLPFRVVAAIVMFLASTLVFISSIIFAVNAQAHNYLPFFGLDNDARAMMGVQDRDRWITWLKGSWDAYHLAALATFYAGILLLLAGVNMIVWEFVGVGTALIMLFLIIANLALTIGFSVVIQRRKQRTSPLARPGSTLNFDVAEKETDTREKIQST
jgi:hypothetical protein